MVAYARKGRKALSLVQEMREVQKDRQVQELIQDHQPDLTFVGAYDYCSLDFPATNQITDDVVVGYQEHVADDLRHV